MNLLVVLMLLPLLIYCLVQSYRDVRRRDWILAVWGGVTILFLAWLIEAMTRGPSY